MAPTTSPPAAPPCINHPDRVGSWVTPPWAPRPGFECNECHGLPADAEVWPVRGHLRVQQQLVRPDGTRLHDWPPQVQPPIYGDLIILPSGVYRVIRRGWDLSEPGLVTLEVVVEPMRPTEVVKR